jgi:uncharacterized membrane protein
MVIYYLLYILGLRDPYIPVSVYETQSSNIKPKYNRLDSIINRRVQPTSSVDAQNSFLSQPRQIVRLVYRKTFQRDLSPPASPRKRMSEIRPNVNQVGTKRSSSSETDWLLWCRWLHPLGVLIILGSQCVIMIAYLSSFHPSSAQRDLYLGHLFFQFVYPLQYIFAYMYFRLDHFDKWVLRRRNDSDWYFYLLGLVGVVSTMTALDLYYYYGVFDGAFPYGSSFGLLGRIFVGVYLFVFYFLANMVLSFNLSIFASVFYYHYEELHIFVQEVKYLDITLKRKTITLNEIIEETLAYLYRLQNSINVLENIFSSFSLIGAFSFSFYLRRLSESEYAQFPWTRLVFYVCIQSGYFYIVYCVSALKDQLKLSLRRKQFVDKFIKRYTIHQIEERFERDDLHFIQLNLQEENASILDWMLLNEIVNTSWTEFKFLGVSLSDFGLIKRVGLFLFLLITVNQIGSVF